MSPDAPSELRIGRLTKAHGVKGALRLELLTDFPDRFVPGREVDIEGRRLRINHVEPNDDGLILTFEGVEDRNAAQGLVGRYCTLPLTEARPLPNDHYYHFQLVGLRVIEMRGQREIGRVEEVLPYAANDVLRVSNGRIDTLVPMVKHIVKSIDPAAGIIRVDLPDESEA